MSSHGKEESTGNADVTRTLSPGHLDYPARLADLCRFALPGSRRWSTPPTLHVRGTVTERPLVAIVGTRAPCEGSLRWTRELVRALGRRGYAVGSGGARGIDACAHLAAVALGVPTLVVTVGGLDVGGPSRVRGLFDAVLAAGGGLVSLDPDGTSLERREFFPRNHVLAALSCGVVAVEVRPKPGQGGTGHTARAARALRREVMTLPHAPWEAGGPGCLALSRAGVALVSSATEVLARLSPRDARAAVDESSRETTTRERARQVELPERRSSSSSSSSRTSEAPRQSLTDVNSIPPLGDTARKVLDALEQRAMHLDAICAATGCRVGEVMGALLECCMEGLVLEDPPGSFSRC